MGYVVGIDLGTANSCVAVLRDGQVEVIPDSDKNRTMPSVVSISTSQEPIVGHAAVKRADLNRLNTIFAVKRLIGRTFGSSEVTEFAARVPYNIISAPNGDAWVSINDQATSPEEVSAHILTKLKQIAEAHLQDTVSHAVITVPAHFNDAQRQATKDAGKIAGLQVLSIINEPTAAALAYGLDISEDKSKDTSAKTAGDSSKQPKQIDRTIAVFDLGSGTFDITILALKNGIFDVLSTGGDTYLGGEDFDLAVVDYLLREFKRQHSIDLSKDRIVLQRLKEAAKGAKQVLSSEVTYEVSLPYICRGTAIAAPKDLKLVIDRTLLERIVSDLLDRLEDPCLQAMADASLTPANLDDVILVGGMTRMPAVKKRCEKIFNKKPIDTIDPDEAVASGAAIQAALLQGVLKGLRLADVTSLSLGIEVQGGKMVTLLPRNSKLPAKVTELFTTSAPNQREISVHIAQGESAFIPENKTLGRFELNDIESASRGVPRIEITLEVDADGIVHVSAKNLKNNRKQEIEIINSSGLDDAEISNLVNENRRQAAYELRRAKTEKDSQKQRERAESVAESTKGFEEVYESLRSAIFQTQFRLDSEGKRFKGERRARLEKCLDAARAVLNSANDPKALSEAYEAVNKATSEFEQYLEAA